MAIRQHSLMADDNLNSLYTVRYGNSRWYKSAYRQYINSDAYYGQEEDNGK